MSLPDSRRMFCIPENKFVILFVSHTVENRRKGVGLLAEALRQLPDKSDYFLCIVGNYAKEADFLMDSLYMGKIQDEYTMAKIYSAANAFIIPSLEDNLPNTVIESLTCGTPVLGFSVGGIKEMIQDGINGYLCTASDPSSLADAIGALKKNVHTFDRKTIRKNAIAKYAYHQMAPRYVKYYQKVLVKETFSHSATQLSNGTA